jgi:lysophospholipase L1-like esterase
VNLRLRRVLTGLGLLAASLAVALVLAELVARAALPANRFYVWPPGMRVEIHPDPRYVQGVRPSGRFTTNAWGLRGDEFGADSAEYRILVIGGSTSEMRYLDDSLAWPQLTRRALGATPDGRDVWMGSAGRSGMNARDHVVQVQYLVPQLPRIDAVVVLVGINDMTLALSDTLYRAPAPITDPAAAQRQLGRAFTQVPNGVIEPEPWRNRVALYRLYLRVRQALASARGRDPRIQDNFGFAYERWRSFRRRAERVIAEPPDLTAALAEYRRNLHAIVDRAAAHGVRLVLMTQPSLLREDLAPEEERRLWLGGVGDFQRGTSSVYYAAAALARSLAPFNAALLEVCAARGVGCIDLAAAVPRDTTMFSDDVHFTEAGSRRVAEVLAAWWRGQPPFAGTADSAGGGTGRP